MARYLPYWAYYLHQGMLTALMLQGVTGYFRHQGLDLASLSLLSLTFLPWIGKCFWAPWCERHCLGLRGNRYLGSLVALQLGMAAVLLLIALLRPEQALMPILLALMLLAVLSATHDVYADAITITSTDARQRPFANAAQVGGSYLGVVFGSLAFLWLAERWGWQAGFLGMALLSLSLLLPLAWLPITGAPVQSRPPRLDRQTLRALWPALCLVAIYYLAMRGLMAVQTVLLLDRGLEFGQLGMVTTLYGTVASGLGILLGSWMARRLGAWRCLLPCMLVHAGISVAAALGVRMFSLPNWLAVFALVNVAAAIGFVTLYTLLMGQVRAHQPASDYALFQSVDAAVAMLASLAAMQVAHRVGYGGLLAGLAVVAVVCVWPARGLCKRLELMASSPASRLPQGSGSAA